MRSNPLPAMSLGLLALGLGPAAQGPVARGITRAHRRGGPAPVVVPADEMNRRSPLGRDAATVRPPAGGPQRQAPQARPGAQDARPASVDDASGPRPLDDRRALPFAEDRPILEVDGVVIRSAELNRLVAYYRSFRPGSDALLLRDAVAALVPRAVVQARYAGALPEMKARIEEARKKLQAGQDFAAVVAEYSDDDEAPTPDGRYTFGREAAVQPFDRLAHSTVPGEVSAPFLTQYGYHFLEALAYHRGPEPKSDRAEVRHVLVMYPFETADPRAEIRSLVESCRIRVLEPGFRNAVPPELRDRILP